MLSANKQRKRVIALELTERKRKILYAIIRNYLETGEPVGSRTISKYTDLNLSSATIRNEMSDLEEMGYIIQPHTSAGRIPSDKGYRLYVNELVEEKTAQVSTMNSLMIAKTNRMEEILKQVVRLLASRTNYTTMISAPSYRGNKVKFIQLSRLNARQLLNVVVIEGNVVKNHILDLDEEITEEQYIEGLTAFKCNTLNEVKNKILDIRGQLLEIAQDDFKNFYYYLFDLNVAGNETTRKAQSIPYEGVELYFKKLFCEQFPVVKEFLEFLKSKNVGLKWDEWRTFLDFVRSKATDFPKEYYVSDYFPTLIDDFYYWYCNKHKIPIPKDDEDDY